MAALESNPKIMAVIKASGISAQEFLIIPSCVQITASVYNSQAQGSAMGAMVSQENIAFYVKNKAEIDQIVKNWQARTGREVSGVVAEAIAAYVQAEERQLAEIREGLEELDAGQTVSHERVSAWLRSWGKSDEAKAPR